MNCEGIPQEALNTLAAHAAAADGESVWPTASWEAVRAAGALTWALPTEAGGAGLTGVPLLEHYERLATACLTSCFLLSQRDAAVRRIADSDNASLRHQLLPALAAGERFATVGLSQLTTSRQHTGPALTAEMQDGILVIDGTIPWVTGAARANHLVVGAVLADGRQILAALPARLPGLEVGPPLDLAALQGSLTAEVRCRRVEVEPRWFLAGPVATVLKAGRGPGGLETSCLALGLAVAASAHVAAEAVARPELASAAERLGRGCDLVRRELHRLVSGAAPDEAAALRARANALALRSAQTALAASKGSGFLRSHPAQRWARQALFFLVWSCPRPAVEATLGLLLPDDGEGCRA